MKTIIAGSRRGFPNDQYLVWYVADAVIASGFTITEVVSGHARGVDLAGEAWAASLNIPIKTFIPDWSGLGKAAGIIRNHQMGDYAEALIAIWNGYSRGTKDMIEYAKKKGIRVFVYTPSKPI